MNTVKRWWNQSLKDGAIAGREKVIEELACNERNNDSGKQSIIDRYMQTELVWHEENNVEPAESKNDTRHCTWRDEFPPKTKLFECYGAWLKQAGNKGTPLGPPLFWKDMKSIAPYTETRPKRGASVVQIGSLEECRDKFKPHTQNAIWVFE